MLLDIERIAPCLPGARAAGDRRRRVPRRREGQGRADHRAVQGHGQARRGRRGGAPHRDRRVRPRHARAGQREGDDRRHDEAKRTAGTIVDVVTDLSITGKVAQFGRGVLADVSSKLMGQFVENLERDVLSDDARRRHVARRGSASRPRRPAPVDRARGRCPADRLAPEAEPVDLFEVAGAPVTKRLVPLGIGARRAVRPLAAPAPPAALMPGRLEFTPRIRIRGRAGRPV